jgi:hypothetical protein
MSLLRPLLSRRGRLVFVAAALLLIAALVAAPSVSGAKPPASVKQYLSKISPTAVSGGTTGNSFTVTITDCGGTPLEPPCTASSTIQLGTAQILVPTRFSNVAFVSASSPDGRNWMGSWDGTYIQGWSVTGADKLNPGDSVDLTFTADVSGCETGSFEFTTTAWGSTPTHTGETFRPLQQPTVSVNGCALESGDSITDPVTNQTETISGFGGKVNVTFGGNLSCAFDPIFGAQWGQFHLKTQVNITPGEGFTPAGPKISTSRFATEGNDSSLYLICYAVPDTGQSDPPFTTRGDGVATKQTVDGENLWVGILPNCYDPISGHTRAEPCVSEQFLDVIPNPDQIVISVRMPPQDPFKK